MDFLDPGKNSFILDAVKFSFKNKTKESCGIFVEDSTNLSVKFLPLINLNESNPDHFIINDPVFYQHYTNGTILSLFHNHLNSDSNPSLLDIETSEALGMPSYIYSRKTKSSYLLFPESYKPKPLLKRHFIPHFQDCLTFVKDFFDIELNIKLTKSIKNWARPRKNYNASLIKNIEINFFEVNVSQIQNYDLIVFKPSIDNYMHLGVYVENQYLFHHPICGYPLKELFVPGGMNQVYKVYRYKVL